MKNTQRYKLVLGLVLGFSFTLSSLSVAAVTTEPDTLSVQEAISLRQSAFELLEHNAKLAGNTLKEKEVDWDNLKQLSRKMSEASASLESLFPKGSLEGSKAKDNIWSDGTKFERLLNEMDDGFEQLYQATIDKDKRLAQQGIKQAQSTCKACHRQYRSRW